MTLNHAVSDLVTRVRNGYLAKKSVINCPSSNLRENILKILKDEGYILSYSKIKDDKSFYRIDIHLKYHLLSPVVNEIKVVSKPGKRIYCGARHLPLVKNGLGLVVISTSQGVLSDHEARAKGLGGEILFTIF